ncbi:MSC_0775 family lipoprotein [Mycoplasmopsis pulmonis]|uniref:MSC_0775 family lipoprotein n=1 Tax=Mycoplasmopsis pulmonis TaxID=2107 RepID=UPI002ACDB47F|nr:hypothetical protein [Mycoplasmopsis pulmonis]MDZ7293732.1 hypothetical protein [Mycoplasmopsis pulmonis]
MTQKEKKQKNKFKKLIKLLSLGIALPLVASFGVVACSTPTQKENQTNSDTSQSTNQPDKNDSSTSLIKTHKELAIDHNKSAYQLNKFLELKLDKHIKVEIENNLDVSNVLAEHFNSNGQWKKLKLNTSALESDEVKNILKANKIDLTKFKFYINENSILVDEQDSRKINFNIHINAVETKENFKLFSSHIIESTYSGFKKNPSELRNMSALEKFIEDNPQKISLKSDKNQNDISFFDIQEEFRKLEDDDFEKLLVKRKDLLKKYFDLQNLENKNEAINFKVNKVYIDNNKENTLAINLRIIRAKLKEVLIRQQDQSLAKRKVTVFTSKEMIFKVSKDTGAMRVKKDDLEFIKANAKLRAFDYSSAYNFDFENMEDSLSKVIVDSTHKKLKYKVLDVTKNDQYTRSWKVKITSISEDPNLDKIEFVKNFEVPKRAYIFNQELQDVNKNYSMDLGEFQANQLTEVTDSLRQRLQSPIVSGGWLDIRSIYHARKVLEVTKQLHLAEDVLVEKGTKILAPFDGEIVAAYYLKSERIGYGIGTVTILKVKKKDLIGHVDQSVIDNELAETDSIFISFIHLDDSYLKELGTVKEYKSNIVGRKQERITAAVEEISAKSPKKVKKGDVIGIVGTIQNNGGWVPHVHVEVYYGSSNWYTKEGIKQGLWQRGIHSNTPLYNSYDSSKPEFNPLALKPQAVTYARSKLYHKIDDLSTLAPGEIIDEKYDRRIFYNDYIAYRQYGVLNPNLFFRFNGSSSLKFNIFDIFPNLEEEQE